MFQITQENFNKLQIKNKIFRVEHKDNYTVKNNYIHDVRMSGLAKAIHDYMISKPDDWQFYTQEIARHFTDTEDKITKALNELQKNKFINRRKIKVAGKYQYIYHIFEVPKHETFGNQSKEIKKILKPKLVSNVNNELKLNTLNSRSSNQGLEMKVFNSMPSNEGLQNDSILSTNILSTDERSTDILQSTEKESTEEREYNKEKANAFSCHSLSPLNLVQKDKEKMLAYPNHSNTSIENQSNVRNIQENANNINIPFVDFSQNASDYNNAIENQSYSNNSQTYSKQNAQFSEPVKQAKKAKSKFAYDFNENLLMIEKINEIFKNSDNYIFSDNDIQKIKIFFVIFQYSFKKTNMNVDEWFRHSKYFDKKNWMKSIRHILGLSMLGSGFHFNSFEPEEYEKEFFDFFKTLTEQEKNPYYERMRARNAKFAFSNMGFAYIIQNKYREISNLYPLKYNVDKKRFCFPDTDVISDGFEKGGENAIESKKIVVCSLED